MANVNAAPPVVSPERSELDNIQLQINTRQNEVIIIFFF